MKKNNITELVFILDRSGSMSGLEGDTINFNCDSKGTALNYSVLNETISDVRCECSIRPDWKARIAEDYSSRKQER